MELAKLQETQGDLHNARKNYLEAASIFVLEAEVNRDDAFLKDANDCYRRSKAVLGESVHQELGKTELAKRTIVELEEFEGDNMCGEHRITTMIELAKRQEKNDPKEAANNYLKAADMLLKESYNDKKREEEYLSVANKIYTRAKELKALQTEGGIDEAGFKQADVVAKKDNKITFADIGGLQELKEEIRFKIIEPFKDPDLFRHYGKNIGGGILMYGPPGCGKSLIAMATANEAHATFFHVKSSDLKSKFVGETEKNIAELFKKAREKQPSIIFFDEFEALGGDRSESHSHERSAVAQLLTEMDGMDSKEQQILLLAATNEPWSIDPALRREGRFGRTLFIPQPDAEARKHIFSLIMSRRPTKEIDYAKLTEATDGFTGADIKAACEMATDIPLRESLKTKKRRKITMDDFNLAISGTRSILTQWYAKAQEQVKKKKLEGSFAELVTAASQMVKIEMIA